MSQFLQEAKQRLSQTVVREADEEDQLLQSLLAQAGPEKLLLAQ